MGAVAGAGVLGFLVALLWVAIGWFWTRGTRPGYRPDDDFWAGRERSGNVGYWTERFGDWLYRLGLWLGALSLVAIVTGLVGVALA